MENKYGNLLSIMLIVAIVIVVVILGFFGYKVYNSNKTNKKAEDVIILQKLMETIPLYKIY